MTAQSSTRGVYEIDVIAHLKPLSPNGASVKSNSITAISYALQLAIEERQTMLESGMVHRQTSRQSRDEWKKAGASEAHYMCNGVVHYGSYNRVNTCCIWIRCI